MSDPTQHPVAVAFADLAAALAADALADPAGFERAAAFRRRAMDLATRYASGLGLRTVKGSAV
jgi:hypothetical protein